ncbi:ALP1-like protein isoform X1 [Tanacetum coccineum]|uniref:ALP1-like protein isoform X1 n=1 Tax=Tanacetum coccineum TaxID=301880 RepID=A0ABQ4WCN5_9ASTR
MLKDNSSKKTIPIYELSNDERVEGVYVAIPLAAVDEAKYGLERVMLNNGFFFFQFSTKEGKNIDGRTLSKDDKVMVPEDVPTGEVMNTPKDGFDTVHGKSGNEGMKPVSFASMFKDNSSKKTVQISELCNEERVKGADVAIPLAAVDEVSNRVAGANNDLTVLNHSPLFDDLLDGIAPVVPYEVNGVTFEKGYYLADGIYPQWATFVKSFTVARDEKNAVFKR